MDNLKELNNHGGLFLTQLFEPTDNSLIIEVRESFTSPLAEEVTVGAKVLKDCYRVSINEYGTSFNISFINYVAYQVLNESFYNFNENDYSTFCIYSQSTYLDFILRETYADTMFPDEIRHYSLYCSNHIVHIVSFNEPIITMNTCE